MNRMPTFAAAAMAALCAAAAYDTASITPRTGPRVNFERATFYSMHVTDKEKTLPRVLLVGDRTVSASGAVQGALRGRATVTRWETSYELNRPEFSALLDICLRTHDYAVVCISIGSESKLDPATFARELARVVRDIRAAQPASTKIVMATVPRNGARSEALSEEVRKVAAAEGADAVSDFSSGATADKVAAAVSPFLPSEAVAVEPEARKSTPTCTDYPFPIHPAIGRRENTEWSSFYSFHETDADSALPRVLFVGDSITQSFYKEAAERLNGKAVVSVWVNSYSTIRSEYQAMLRVFLRNHKYAIVHYNSNSHCAPSDSDWRKGLLMSLEMIRAEQPQAKLVWMPSPLLRDRKPGVKGRYYEAGCDVIGKFGVDGVNDLYEMSKGLSPDMYRDEIHLCKEAQVMAAKQAVETILPLLPDWGRTAALPARLGKEASGRTFSKVKFDGGLELPKFKVGADGIWRTSLPGVRRFDELWVNGRRAVLARTPDAGSYFYAVKPVYEAEDPYQKGRTVDVDNRGAITTIRRPIPRGATFCMLHGWDTDWGRVYHVDPETGLLILDKPVRRGFFFWPKWAVRFFCENFREALDAPGEWYADGDEVLYIPRPGETPETAVAVVPMAEKLLVVDGAENLVFEDVEFGHSGYRVPETLFTRQSAFLVDAAIELRNVRNVTFRNCRFVGMATHGIHIAENCRGVKLTGCRFEDIGAGGVFMGPRQQQPPETETRDIELSDSVICGTSRRFPEGAGILATYVSGARILRNEIADIGYTGLSLGYVWGFKPQANRDNLIAYNRIHHLGRATMSDMAGIYTLGDNRGSRVFGNLIYDVVSYDYTGGGGEGLYTDEGSRGLLFESNFVHHVKGGAINQNYGCENVFRDNVLDVPGRWAFTVHSHVTGTNLSAVVEGNVFVTDGKVGSLRSGSTFTNEITGVLLRGNRTMSEDEFRKFDSTPWNFAEIPPERVKANPLPPLVLPPPVEMPMSYSTSFESKSPGGQIHSFFRFPSKGGQDLVCVTDRESRTGRKCAKATDDPKREPSYLPHIFVRVPGAETSRVTRVSFSFKATEKSSVHYVCRDWLKGNGPFMAGQDIDLTALPRGIWHDVSIVYTSGRGRMTEIAVRITDENGNVERDNVVKPLDGGYVRPTWIGFLSYAKEKGDWYLDDFSLKVEDR